MIHTGDCLDIMPTLDAESIDAIVTDPPYGLEFMGKAWDRLGDVGKTSKAAIPDRDGSSVYGRTRVSNFGSSNVRCRTCGKWKWGHKTGDAGGGGKGCECAVPDFPNAAGRQGQIMQTWHEAWAREALRVAKPGAYLLAFGGTRTVHRLACAIEDAGWIIRDMLVWGYASGFPKGRANLKPAWEPIVMARKPGPLRPLAIDECRIGTADVFVAGGGGTFDATGNKTPLPIGAVNEWRSGRWPANVILSDEIFEPGIEGVIIAGSLTGTMTAWSPSPDNEQSPTVSPARRAAQPSSPTGPGDNSRASATEPAGMQLDAWGTSTDTPKPDTGCSDGTTAGAASTSGSTDGSGSRPTVPSQPDTSSTTETATGSTTGSTISRSSAGPSTPSTTRPRTPESSGIVATPRPGTSEPLSDDSANWRRDSLAVPADSPGYSRYFIVPKAARSDREPVLGGLIAVDDDVDGSFGLDAARPHTKPDYQYQRKARANVHPTVKPTDLMRHLVRLVTPQGGTVLDPFLGSGTTALAAEMEGFAWVGIEREPEYVTIAEARLNGTQKGLAL